MKKIFFILLLSLVSRDVYSQDKKIDSLKQLITGVNDDSSACNLFLSIGWNSLFSYSDTALRYAQRALVLSKALKDSKKESEAMLLNGYALLVTGDYPLALEFLLQGLHIEERIHPARMTEVFYAPIPVFQLFYYVISETYKDMGDFENALLYLRKGMVFKRIDERDNLMEGFARLSQIYERANQLDSAIFYGKKAFDLDIQLNGRSERTPIPISLGNAYSKKNDFSSALKYYHIALNTNEIEKKDVVEAYNGVANTFLLMNEIDSATYYVHQCIATEELRSYPLGTLNTYKILADIFKKTGEPDSVVKYLEKSIFLGDSLFNQRKIHSAQNLSFNERLRQQEIAQEKKEYIALIKMYLLLAAAAVFLIIAFLLYRNNINKQRANSLLQKQKEKVEMALTELRTTQAQLIQSEKMASLGELTAGIAHEIQNPLNFVNNFSEVNNELIEELKSHLASGGTKIKIEEQDEILNDIFENNEKIALHGKRADAIVKGMLQHSRMSTGQKEATDINALCDECVRLAYHGLRAKDNSFNATIGTDFDPNVGKVNVVPQDMGRVLLNLINNALYAVSEKQKQGLNGYEPALGIATTQRGGRVEIEVKDNGIGIPQKIVDKIFQPFFTTKPTGQGTGLGLSLAYDIIKAHGGELKVETKEGEGSEFVVQLPA